MDCQSTKQKVPNIRDVARLAGVSRSTVSLVLNDSPVPSAQTCGKVLKAAQELNYRVDPLFRQAFKRRKVGSEPQDPKTQTIGFLTLEHILKGAQHSDGYYSRVLAGIQHAAEEHDYHLMLKAIKTTRMALPSMVTEGRVDGVIIEGNYPKAIRKMLVERLPVVFIDRTYPELSASSVMPNIEQAVHTQLEYLWELGHRNIVTFQHASTGVHNATSLRAFHEFFATRNHPLAHPGLCKPHDITPATHLRALAEYARCLATASPRPTALITWDVYACDLLLEFARLGLRVPKDLSILGMDDCAKAQMTQPQLSSYRFPMEEMGNAASELVIEHIQDRGRSVRHLLINGQLIERASCSPIFGKNPKEKKQKI